MLLVPTHTPPSRICSIAAAMGDTTSEPSVDAPGTIEAAINSCSSALASMSSFIAFPS